MIIGENQIFNLWDTNGRRADVLNALCVYLQILKDQKELYPEDKWGTYPFSLSEYRFYEEAISRSADVFQKHSNRDVFVRWLEGKEHLFFKKDNNFYTNEMCTATFQSSTKAKPKSMSVILDESIEQRARHYSSNLVKWGFAYENREITPAGIAFMSGMVKRDELESLLPIDATNINLLRQAAKLRIYADKPNDRGNYAYFSPLYMALYLISNGNYSTNDFLTIIQQTSPFYKDKYTLNEIISRVALKKELAARPIPDNIQIDRKLTYEVFQKHFPNTKSGRTVKIYYEFYELLTKLILGEDAVDDLSRLFETHNSELEQAFGSGSKLFIIEPAMNREQFLFANNDCVLLNASSILELNKCIYSSFVRSKVLDQAREYSDTTLRMLSATGVFSFSRMPELHFPAVIRTIFGDSVEQFIFGESSLEERDSHEDIFSQSLSIGEILQISSADIQQNIDSLCETFDVTRDELPNILRDQKNNELLNHIKTKYPKEKILEILPLFSNRQNDTEIKKFVNPSATVPTIYEYIMAIAWYYIIGDYNLYESLNLSLNGDYEPELHAGGGEGDIVINQEQQTTMIEVTLMNKQAQKRGEWEPVLRHAVNLTVDKAPIPVITLFVADELDNNTINIWRAVTTVPLESSSTGERTNRVVIMPFKNAEICDFLKQNISGNSILSVIRKSYDEIKVDFDENWRDKILRNISA